MMPSLSVCLPSFSLLPPALNAPLLMDSAITKNYTPPHDDTFSSTHALLQVNMLYADVAVEEYLRTLLEALRIFSCHEPHCPTL